MRNLKRMLGLFMAVAMMMSMLVFSTSAATVTFPDADDIVHKDAVNMAVALNIINGRDTGNFDPKDNIRRGEMAKMITIILNGGLEPVVSAKTEPSYSDIRGHWAEGYIEYCTQYSSQNFTSGIINGMGDGTFAPDAEVTATQAAKMLLVAMGYNADSAGFTGSNWAVAIGVEASTRGLYEDMSISNPNEPMNRDDAAQMIWNALNATMVTYDISISSDGEGGIKTTYTQKDYEDNNHEPITLLINKYKAVTDYDRVMTGYKWNEREKEYTYTMTGANNNSYDSSVDFTALFGMNVKVVYKTVNGTTTVFGMYPYKSEILAEGIIDDMGEGNNNNEFKFDGTRYTLSSLTYTKPDGIKDVIMVPQNQWNNSIDYDSLVTTTAAAGNDKYADIYEARLIDNTGDGKVDIVVYTPYAYGEVNTVSASKITVKEMGGDVETVASNSRTLSMDFDDHNIYDNPEAGDYVMIVDSSYTAFEENVVTLMPSFDGAVTGKADNGANKLEDIQIDGTWYVNRNNVDVTAKGEYTFYAVGSMIFYVDEITAPSIENVVFLANVRTTGFVGEVEARIYHHDGTYSNVVIKEIKVLTGADQSDNKTIKLSDLAANPVTLNINGDATVRYTNGVDLVNDLYGHIFTYSVKSGEYTLTEVGQKNRIGFSAGVYDTNYTFGAGHNAAAVDNSGALGTYGYGNGTSSDYVASLTAATSSKESRLPSVSGTYSFADDALVFVKTNERVEVMNGAKAQKLKNADMDVLALYGVYNTSNGSNNLKVASLVTDSGTLGGVAGTNGNYGYIARKFGGDDTHIYVLWNAAEASIIEYTDEDAANTETGYGMTISFTDLGDKEIEDVRIMDGLADGKTVDRTIAETDYDGEVTSILGAISSFRAGSYVVIYDETGVPHEYDITKDTQFITVGTKETTEGNITRSLTSSNGLIRADDVDNNGGMFRFDGDDHLPNVLIVYNSDLEAELIVIDNDNNYQIRN